MSRRVRGGGVVGGALGVTLAAAGFAAGSGGAPDEEPPVPVVQPAVDLAGALSPSVGAPVRASRGVWSGGATGYVVTWERCAVGRLVCAPIEGAGGPEYVPVPDDVGRGLRVRVEAGGPGGAGAAVSAVTPPVTASGGRVVPPSADAHAAADGGVLRGLPARVVVRPGGRLRLRGRVEGHRPGAQVVLRDPAGVEMARSEVADGGAFRIATTARQGGRWTLSTAGGRREVLVAVRPVVLLLGHPRTVRTPGTVRVRGRLLPPVYGKTVDLQYLDPGRGWRLWRQTRTGIGGRFEVARVLARNPRAPRFPLQIRIAVPADHGSPFAPAVGPVAVVLVR